MYYSIKQSKPRTAFKKRFGQANHFLITSIIGLDYVSKHEVTCPEDLSTSWNPHDKQSSVERSRKYVLKSFLASSVDSLESYFIMVNREPKLIPADMQHSFDDTEVSRSVAKKLDVVFKRYNGVSEVQKYAALVALSIQWRNNLIHFGAENEVDQKYTQILESNPAFYTENCCGLDVETALEHFKKNDSPSFKETASIIASTHRLVQLLDECFLNELDLKAYAYNVLKRSKLGNNSNVLKSVSEARGLGKIIRELVMVGFTPDETRGLSQDDLQSFYLEFSS